MSRLSDPQICPDCRAPLDPYSVCTGCGLVLQGAPAAEIWRLLQEADRIIESVRSAPAETPTAPPIDRAPAAAGPQPTAGLPTAPPIYPGPRPARRGPRLSVPVVLLGLGGICVLVAATVFVAVTWGSLGLAGRTTILLGVTGICAGAAIWVTRRGLRAGAETLWLIAHVLIAIDVVAATVADLAGLDSLDLRHVTGGLGLLLLTSSLCVSLWATKTEVPRLFGLVGVALAATLITTAAEAWAADRSAVATALSLPLLASAALLVDRISEGRLRPHAYGIGFVGTLSWLVLVGHGVSRAESNTSLDWWQGFLGWPLLVAAAAVGVGVLARALPEPVRSLAAGASLVCLALFAMGGTSDFQTKVLWGCGVATALAVLAGFGPRVWARAAAVLVTLVALWAVPGSLLRPFSTTSSLPTTAPDVGNGLDLRFPVATGDLAAWTAPVVAAVAAVCTLALLRHVPDAVRSSAVSVWRALAPALVGLGLAVWLLESEPRLVGAVSAWGVLVIVASAATYAQRGADGAVAAGLVTTAYLLVVGLRLAAPSHLLSAVLATAGAAVLAATAWRAHPGRLHGALVPVLAGAGATLAFVAATHWPYLAGGTGNAAGLTLALVASAIGLGAARLGRTRAGRITLESTALMAGIAGTAFTTDTATDTIILTVLGSTVALVSVIYADRDLLSWGASGLLAIAVIIRVENGTSVPELVALPAALLLAAAGIRRLHLDPTVSSRRALGSALTLGLLPSLVGALEDPVSTRGAIVAAAGLAILAVGIGRRWSAPFVAGALVVALISLRHLGPVAAALSRWISIGSVGLALLLVGITWEARRRDAKRAGRYLLDLR